MSAYTLLIGIGINFNKDEDIARKVGTGICTLFKDNKAGEVEGEDRRSYNMKSNEKTAPS